MIERRIDIGLEIEGLGALDVVSCSLREGLSQVTRAEIAVASRDDIDFAPALLRPATLTVFLEGLEARRWSLRLGGARLIGASGGTLRHALELHAPLWTLGLGLSTRKFRDRTIQAIVTSVLADAGIASVWRTAGPGPERSYVAQYRESDLAFVRRLLEHDGIHFSIDEQGGVVFGDDSGSSPEVEPVSRFELVEAGGALHHGDLGIHELHRGARVAAGAATVNDHDWKAPHKHLLKTRVAARDAELETYSYPAGFRDPDEGARLAQLRLEAQRVPASFVEGKGNVTGFAPGRWFTFGDAAGEVFAGEYLLVEVEHELRVTHVEDRPESGDRTYENQFRAIPRAVPWRPALVTPRPTVAGVHTAMVRGPAGSEIHTDRHGRFKAQFHWDREATGTDADSRWVRMLQESATSMTLARVGWEVAVAYIDGDPDRPIGVARQINGVMAPAYSQPAKKTVMAIKTPSSPASGGYSELRLDDSAGAMHFDLRAEKDYLGIVKNDKTERIGHDETHFVRKNLTHVVERHQTVTIGHDSSTAIVGNLDIVVRKDRSKLVGGDETIDVGGSASVVVNGNEKETVGSMRKTLAGGVAAPSLSGMASGAVAGARSAATGAVTGAARALVGGGGMAGAGAALGAGMRGAAGSAASGATGGLSRGISVAGVANMLCQGSISRSTKADTRRTVGGAFISAALAEASTSVKMAFAETIGGAKVTLSRKGISQKVGGPMSLTVGGAIIRIATGDISTSAKNIRVNVGGAASFDSKVRLSMESATITVQGLSGLKLDGAGAVLDLAPGSLSMKGSSVLLDADVKIVVTGANEHLTKG